MATTAKTSLQRAFFELSASPLSLNDAKANVLKFRVSDLVEWFVTPHDVTSSGCHGM
jgi:hypothetical protein